MDKPLTRKQRELLIYIRSYTAHNGYPPTLREMAKHMGTSSVSTIYEHLHTLRRKGFVQRHTSDGIRKTRVRDIPVLIKVPILGVIAAGLPIEPLEDPEPIFVSTDLVKRSDNHYALRVTGDSMIDDGIQDGDVVVIKAQNYVDHKGQTIVAVIKGGATLKRFGGQTPDGSIKLLPRNPRMKTMLVSPEDFEVRGRLVGLVRSIE